MKKNWLLLSLAIAILCRALNSEVWTTRYYWHVPAMPTILMWASLILGIPSALCLAFYVLRFVIGSPVASANKVTFLMMLWAGIIVIVLMCLFPPWVRVIRLPSSNIKGTIAVGYAPLWQPPEPGLYYTPLEKLAGIPAWSKVGPVSIDFPRLLLQCFIIILVAGGLLYSLKSTRNHGRPPQP